MEAKQEKRKINIAVTVVAELEEGKIRMFHLWPEKVRILGAITAAVLVLLLVFGIAKAVALSGEESDNMALTGQIQSMAEKNEQLQKENAELSEKVSLLSSAVNDKVRKESEEAEKYVPTGFPLSGTAAILEEQDLEAVIRQNTGLGGEAAASAAAELTKEPIVHFSASGGTTVVATGNGTVASIAEDTAYGKVLTLDHGNGYVSIYRVAAEPKVKEGDELTKGTMLFEIGPDGGLLGYQVQQDKSYIDPLELIEISG